MPSPELGVLIAAGAAFAGWAGMMLRNARRRRRAEARLDSGLGKFTEGETATVVGKVRAEGTIEAALSGKACVAYEARLRARRYGVAVAPELVRKVMVPFVLETESGSVRVDGDTFELSLPVVPLIPRNLAREAVLAQSFGIEAGMHEISCDEVRVEPGQRVAVHGVVAIDTTPGEGYREAGRRITLLPHPEHALTIGEPR